VNQTTHLGIIAFFFLALIMMFLPNEASKQLSQELHLSFQLLESVWFTRGSFPAPPLSGLPKLKSELLVVPLMMVQKGFLLIAMVKET